MASGRRRAGVEQRYLGVTLRPRKTGTVGVFYFYFRAIIYM